MNGSWSVLSFLSLAPVPLQTRPVPVQARGPAPLPGHLMASAPGTTESDSAKARIQTMADSYLKACDQGVDLAKSGFMRKLLGAGVAAALTGVAIAVAAASGGAAAPLVAIAGVRLLVAASDAACAWKCWRDAQAAAAGRPVAAPLPMGSNSVGNFFHQIFTACGVSPQKASAYADRASAVACIGLAAAALGVGIAAPAADLAGKVTRLVAGTLAAAVIKKEAQGLREQRQTHTRLRTEALRLRQTLAESPVSTQAAIAERPEGSPGRNLLTHWSGLPPPSGNSAAKQGGGTLPVDASRLVGYLTGLTGLALGVKGFA